MVATLVLATQVQWANAQGMMITTVGNNTVSMLLIDKQGGSAKQYLGQLKGSVLVDANQHVTALNGTILSLETDDKKLIPIKKTELQDGTLALTTNDGVVYVIYDLNSNLVGSIRLAQ